MGLCNALWVLVLGCLWLLSAHPVHGRGDTFQVAPTPDYDLEEKEEEEEAPGDDILDINQGLIPLEAPEHSFLLEGDIIKVSPFRSFSPASPRWPKRKGIAQIPYIISYKYGRQSVKIIKEAFEDFAKFTCIQFIPYSYQRDFISIVPLSGCFSSAGRIGGMQVLSLAPDCLKRGKGVVLHELMHVLGFWHEHSRADRDKYISISWNEILTGFEINFIKNWNTNMLDDYDYSSIMHYGRNAFSMTGLPTIVPLSSPPTFLGQRWNLSVSDIAKINKLYKCSQVSAQPEAAPEEAIKEKVMDFIPVQPEPCSTKSNLASAAVRKTTEPMLSSQKTAGEDLSAVAGQLRRTEVAERSTVVSAMTSHARETSGGLQMPSKHVLETTQTRRMKTKTTGNVVEKAPPPWTSQNPNTGWQSRNQYLKAYTPTEQSPTETRVRTAPEMEQTFSSQGSVLSPVEKIHGATMTLGQKEASVEVSGSKATVLETTGEGELSTAVELAGSLGMGRSETDVGMSSPRPSVSVVEKHSMGQSKKAFHQAVTASMNETGSPAYMHPVENILTNVTSSLSSSSTLENPTTISRHVELGEKPQGTKVEVLENIVTVPGSRGREADAESSYHEKSTALPYIQSPSMKNILDKHGDVPLPRKETPVPEILEVQTNYMGWFTSGAPSSFQGAVTVHPVASELNGSLDDSSSRITESFSLLPPHLARHGYEWGTSIRGKPPGTVSWHVTERRGEVESPTLDHAELPSQIPTWRKVASLAMETNVAVEPTEQSSKTAAEPGDNRPWFQASGDDSHHPRRFVTEGWSPSADVKRQTLWKAIEAASIKTLERLPMTQRIDLGLKERPRTTILVRQLPTEPSGSQVSTQREQGDEETPSQPSSTWSRITGAAERHEIQDSGSSNRLRAMVSPKQCGKKLAVPISRTLTSTMGYTTENFSSLNRQLKLGITSRRSPRPRIQESGPTSSRIFQLGRERNTSPRNLGGFTNPGGRNGTSNSTEHLEEELVSVKRNESTPTSPMKRAPEITVVSGTRSAAPLMVGSSHFFTVLAHGEPTLNRPQSRFYLWGAGAVTHPQNLPTRSLEPTTETEIPIQLNKTVLAAGGRSLTPASSTAGLTMGGMSWATARVQEGTGGRHSTGLPSLETQPTSLEGTSPPMVTGSLPSVEPVKLKEGPIGGGLKTATSSLPRNTSLVGTTVALSIDLSSTIILDSRQNQTMMQYDSKQITSTPSKPSGEMPMETNGSTLASTETHGTSHAGLSTRGSHEEHAKLLRFEPGPQTKAKPLEEVTGPISDGETSTHFPEETQKILTKNASRSEKPASAKPTRNGSKASEENRIGATGPTGPGVKSTSQLIPTNSSKETEESTIFNEKKWNVHHPGGPSSQSYSAALLPPRSNVANPKVAPSVSDVYNPHDTEKVGDADVYRTVTKFSLVPAGISLPQRQTLDSAERGRRSSTTYGAKALEKSTETPTKVKRGELFPLATESSRQISETQVAMMLEERTRSKKNKRHLEENESLLASNPIHLHHLKKRSLLGLRATPPPFVWSSPSPDPKLVRSDIGQVNPRRLSVKKLFPKKHTSKIMASTGGTVERRLLPGYLRGSLSHPAIGQDAALSIEDMTKARDTEKLVLRSTSKSKLWSLLQKVSPSDRKKGNKPGPNQRTTGDILISCSFKENLCGWKQSQNDSLNWMLQKEEERSAESTEGRSVSGKPFRSLDGYISLKTSSHLPKQKAVLISPVVYGIRCLQFWYRSTGCTAGKMNFYAKLLNSTEWHKVKSVNGKQDIGWHQVTVYISTTWALQVALEGIVGPEVRCETQIDDLALCQKPCGQCLQ